MKKVVSIVIAAAVCVGAVSCGKKKDSSLNDAAGNNAITLAAYNEAKIEMADDFSSVVALNSDMKSGDILIFGQLKNEKWAGYITTKEFSDHADFEFTPAENETVISAAMFGFGKKGILTCKEDHTFVHIIGSDGAEEKTLDCGELLNPDDDSGFIFGKLFRNGDGFVISDRNNTINSFDKDGNTFGEVNTQGMNILGLTGNSSGSTTVLLQDSGNSGYMAEIDGTELANKKKCNAPFSSAFAMCPGADDDSFAAVFMDGLYTFRDGKWTKLSDLMGLEYKAYSITGIVMTGEREFATVYNGTSMNLLSEKDIAELKSKKTVSLAVYGGRADLYIDLVNKYNQSHPDSEYRIELKQYVEDENTTYQELMDNLKMEIVTGKAPDIIVDMIDGIDPSVFYVDLGEYLRNDPELNADDFIPGYLDAVSIDGKIPMIYPFFVVHTLIGKTRLVGDTENWSYDEFMTKLDSMPEDIELIYGSDNYYKMVDMFQQIVNIDEYVDYSSGTCDFDSPDYISMMKFVKEKHIGMTQEEYDKKFGDEGFAWEYDGLCFRNDKTLLGPEYSFFAPLAMVEAMHGQFGEDVTFAGYPSHNGQGGYISSPSMRFAIMKTSEYPDIAWDFIKSAFTDEEYEKYYGFPVLEDKFIESFNKTLEVTHYDESSGTELPQGAFYYDDQDLQNYILYDAFTQEEADRCMEYVRSCVKCSRRYDGDLENIITEELEEYFNSDKSAEETAEMIQNRASVYLSETYG